ncbi:cupredoxin domain-containing protein [Pseudomonas aeruginosa]
MFPRRLLPASLIVLGVLFGASAQASPAHGQAFGKPAQAAQASRSIEVALGDMYFKPRVIEVKAGETVRFVLKNEGKLLHEFNLGRRGDACRAPERDAGDAAVRDAHPDRHGVDGP